MNVLLIGWSRIASRRVIPALCALPCVGRVDLATRRSELVPPGTVSGRIFDDYADALNRSDAEVVYVSTINSEHERWAEAALEGGRHTIVDKPACLDASTARRLASVAERRQLALAEASVSPYHPQFSLVNELFDDDSPIRMSAAFCFPSLTPEDFRYKKAAGGGALYDLGPYAVSPGRVFFGAPPEEVSCRVTARAAEVESAFSVLLTYPGQRCFVGHFGFGTFYCNQLELLGAATCVTLDRAFTSPADSGTRMRLRRADRDESLYSPPGDAFSVFLETVFTSIPDRRFEKLRDDLVADADVLDRLRVAAHS